MYKIGFQNFRQFVDFKPIAYKDITFLVGRNNSGKSTLVKALLLFVDYLKADQINRFSFNETNIEDVNIVTYDRAKCITASGDFIAFYLYEDNYEFDLIISGKNDSTVVDVNTFEIRDIGNGYRYIVKPQVSTVTIGNILGSNLNPSLENDSMLKDLQAMQKLIKASLRRIPSKTSSEYIKANEDLAGIKRNIASIKSALKFASTSGHFELTTHYELDNLSQIMNVAITEFNSEYELQYHDVQRNKKPRKNFEALKAFKDHKFKIEKSIDAIIAFRNNIENIYLGASLNKQSALFAVRDKKNALAQAIHEYKQLEIDKNQGSKAYQFVNKWFKAREFDIGDSFDIKMYAGESYDLIVNSGGLQMHLADKGMGSIQAALLILRLATIIHKKQLNNKIYTVIIEEPELNLHPALQSKLGDLFHDVHEEFDIKFIVETHSEYLIRTTQLIVKENEYEVRPNVNNLSVIYFDTNQSQWNMNYREDGKFIEEFGSGFFDESRNLVRKLI